MAPLRPLTEAAGWQLLAAALAALAAWLAAAGAGRAVPTALRQLEALARRLVLLEALALEPAEPAHPGVGWQDTARHGPPRPDGPARRCPGLSLVEPVRDPAPRFVATGPRIRRLDGAQPDGRRRQASRARTLAERLAALQRLVANPDPAVRRMARWLARQAVKGGRLLPVRTAFLRRPAGDLRLGAAIRDAERLAWQRLAEMRARRAEARGGDLIGRQAALTCTGRP